MKNAFQRWREDLERRADEYSSKRPVQRVTVNGFDEFYVPKEKENA